jgi:hypothetical protein
LAENEKKENKKPEKKKRSLFHRIVNVFLYFILGLIVLLIIVIGITQTSTFREYARKTVLEEVNSGLNGELYIEKLEGTLFTSVILRNTSLTLEEDTLFHAGKIEVRTSPLQLLFKRIHIRKAEISDARIALIEGADGELNISHLVEPAVEDTIETSDFTFKINIADLSLNNVSFSMQRYDLAGQRNLYDTLNTNDLIIENFNLNLSAAADIYNSNYEVRIRSLSLNPNINNFNVEEISGYLGINQDGIHAEDFYLRTGSSNIIINAAITDYNTFDSLANISHALIYLDVRADRFHFHDLRAFVPSFDIIDDAVRININTDGSFKELDINRINVEYLSTRLEFRGWVRNLDDTDNMLLSLEALDSRVRVSDLNTLMPSLDLPGEYNRVGTAVFDTLHYDGSPDNFKTHFFVRTDIGNLYANSLLDLRKDDMVYDLFFKTYNFDIAPFAGISSNLNSTGHIKGSGTELDRLNTIVDFHAGGSVIDGNRISDIQFKADARNSIVNYSLYTQRDTTELQLAGYFDFTNQDHPLYEFRGFGNNINIADYTGDTTFISNLNFDIEAMGEKFNLEDINLFLSLNVYDSELNENRIDSTRAIVDLRKDDTGDRVINIISDLADISITGNYSIDQSINLINTEIKLLTSIINDKMSEIMPIQDTVITTVREISEKDVEEFRLAAGDTATRIKYLIDLKDFTLATLFLGGNSQLEINGEMFGDLYNEGDSIMITFGITLDYVRYRTPETAMFISNLDLDFVLRNSLKAESFDEISSSLSLTVDRIYTGTDIRGLALNLSLQDNISYFDFSTNYGTSLSTRLVGGFGFAAENISLILDTLQIDYNQLSILNRDQVRINYYDDRIVFDNFNLARNGGNLGITGFLSRDRGQDLTIRIDSLGIGDILANGLGTKDENNLNAVLNMKTNITGSMVAPVIDLNMAVDSVTYRGKNFGSLLTDIDYADRNMALNIRFEEIDTGKEALIIQGNIPIDLAMEGRDTLWEPGSMDITLNADNFNLGAFGDILPQVNRLTGLFDAAIKINGTIEDIQPTGHLAFREVSFLAEANNLVYNAGILVNLDGQNIVIDSLLIQNGSDVRDGGTITGMGRAVLDGFELVSSQISLGGRLKVLSPNSRYAGAPVYGDLVIATRGNIEFRSDADGMHLNAPITIKTANLTIPPAQGAYQNTTRGFVYRFVQDTTDTAVGRMDFESLIAHSQKTGNGNGTAAARKTDFNYTINLQVEDEARIVIVLSREINQNLTAVLRGNVLYESHGGRTDIQGELKLLEGSTLEFIKTFRADGSVRFESDLTNPYLDITATYVDYYYPPDTLAGFNEVQVGVKIKLRGPLADLDKNFVKDEDNIAVYYGEKSIEDDEPDPTKDASDAIMFIITGRFADDLNMNERTAATSQFSGAATSIAGSLIGGVLNQYFGEYVSGVEFRRVGTETRFVFSGRAGGFRYQVGGTQDVFQNISQANLRIEYPVYRGLSLRFERREDIRERAVINEMVNELGLRYRFEF